MYYIAIGGTICTTLEEAISINKKKVKQLITKEKNYEFKQINVKANN